MSSQVRGCKESGSCAPEAAEAEEAEEAEKAEAAPSPRKGEASSSELT